MLGDVRGRIGREERGLVAVWREAWLEVVWETCACGLARTYFVTKTRCISSYLNKVFGDEQKHGH